MLPSVISNFIWGYGSAESEEDSGQPNEVDFDHSTSDEPGDWLLITCERPGSSSISGQSSQTHTESDHDSVCSDGSWIITPAPTFQGPKSGQSVSEAFHPLEDLLIEHPTMSVYHHVTSGDVGSEEESLPQENENERAMLEQDGQQSSINHNRELVLLQNRQRQQLAIHMQVPLTAEQHPSYKALPKPPKMSRKALRRHNANILRSNKPRTLRVQKCCFKAGRRRC